MRYSSAANSAASSPPAPARISRMTSRSSLGSRGSSRTFRSSSSSRLVGLEPRDLIARHRPQLLARVARDSRSSRAPASSVRVDSRRRKASTTGSSRASSRPSRRSSPGSVDDFGSRKLGPEIVVLSSDLGELLIERGHVRGGGSAGRLGVLRCRRWRDRGGFDGRSVGLGDSPPTFIGSRSKVGRTDRGPSRRRPRAPPPSRRSRPRSCRPSVASS